MTNLKSVMWQGRLWNAVINTTNALILHYPEVVPVSHRERRKLLEKLEDNVPKVEELGFRDRYGAREIPT